MDITVVGPGAVGTLLGGLLSLRGHGITFRCRQAVEGGARPVRVRLVLPDRWLAAEAVEAGPGQLVRAPAAVIVTLARHHLHAVRRPDFPRLMGCGSLAGGPPVVFVNADPEEPARLGFTGEPGSAAATHCVALVDAVKLQDNEVELAGSECALVVEKGSAAQRMFAGLSTYRLPVVAVPDTVPYHDALLVSQLLFLPVAMCGMTAGFFLSFPEGRQLAASMLEEGLETMSRAGRTLARLPVMDPQDLLARLQKKPASFEAARQLPDRSYNTVLQGFLRGRPVEASHLNRKVVEMASAAGLRLEWNWRILQKVGRIASLGFYPGPAELLRSIS
jgi:ketopantoate reductase